MEIGIAPSDSLENSEENNRVKITDAGDNVCAKGVQTCIGQEEPVENN
jgi:hypothetical protein